MLRARQCPADFETVFVEIGRFACEEHYSAWRDTVTRWLNECGMPRLLELRKAQALIDRREAYARRSKGNRRPQLVRASIQSAEASLARHAAHYLRSVRNGGWIISPTNDGQWWVGSRRRPASELIEFAKAKGFDPTNLRAEHGFGLDCERP